MNNEVHFYENRDFGKCSQLDISILFVCVFVCLFYFLTQVGVLAEEDLGY